jgi:hypothetical protein
VSPLSEEDPLVLTEPWWDLRGHGVVEGSRRRALGDELASEVRDGHVLYGRTFEVLASCQHCDDILIQVGSQWAIVHLTYAASERPPWPDTEVYGSAADATAAAEGHGEYA